MLDAYGRDVNYLRVCVTDRCNLRCQYCMPAEGVVMRQHDEILRIEEIREVVRTAAGLGVTKVRVTGGEPLVRRGVVDLCREIKAISGINELALTTNGILLEEYAQSLREAGVDRVNISMDSLDPEKYAYMTRGGDLGAVLRGISAAADAGLRPVKLNAVLIGGFNVDEVPAFVDMTRDKDIEVRFIELMPLGEATPFWESGYTPNSAVLDLVPALRPILSGGASGCFNGADSAFVAADAVEMVDSDGDGFFEGVTKLYQLPGAKGRVGLITPISSHFCRYCNRLRLTADGMLKPCLHSDLEIPVRGLTGAALEAAIREAVGRKPANRGEELSAAYASKAKRNMNQIGG